MIDRSYQLSWYNGSVTQQDYDLLQFVTNNNINSVKYLGECSFLQSLLKRESTDPKLCIFLLNHSFKFSTIVDVCNQELENMPDNSFFYLAINKFLAMYESYSTNSVDDYDDAIYDYIKTKIKYPIIKYYSGKDDYGQKFNWGHPLTRFYFLKCK